MSTIGVLGAGTWGTALARILANAGHEVTLWSKLPQEIEALQKTHIHPNLKDVVIPSSLILTADLKETCDNEFILFAVPSKFVRSTAREASEYISDQILIDVAKGFEPDTMLRLSEVIEEETHSKKIVALSGPSHAEEVGRDMPTTIVSASRDIDAAKAVQQLFVNTCLRVYTNEDIEGVEICGAIKNVIALAAGISAGLGYGDNTKAALITRGMAEIVRLGSAMGCHKATFSGLAGIGDLIVTATSLHSRNNRCGMLIGQGKSVEEAVKEVDMVVEGMNAIVPVMQLKEKFHVDMPICSAVNDIVYHGKSPKEVVEELMSRDFKAEF